MFFWYTCAHMFALSVHLFIYKRLFCLLCLCFKHKLEKNLLMHITENQTYLDNQLYVSFGADCPATSYFQGNTVYGILLSKYSQNAKILNKIVFLIRWSIDAPFTKNQLIHRFIILKKGLPFLCKEFDKAFVFFDHYNLYNC